LLWLYADSGLSSIQSTVSGQAFLATSMFIQIKVESPIWKGLMYLAESEAELEID